MENIFRIHKICMKLHGRRNMISTALTLTSYLNKVRNYLTGYSFSGFHLATKNYLQNTINSLHRNIFLLDGS